MDRVTRCEFVGSPILLIILFLTGIGIPIALLYLMNKTVAVAQEIADANAFLAAFSAGKVG